MLVSTSLLEQKVSALCVNINPGAIFLLSTPVLCIRVLEQKVSALFVNINSGAILLYQHQFCAFETNWFSSAPPASIVRWFRLYERWKAGFHRKRQRCVKHGTCFRIAPTLSTKTKPQKIKNEKKQKKIWHPCGSHHPPVPPEWHYSRPQNDPTSSRLAEA